MTTNGEENAAELEALRQVIRKPTYEYETCPMDLAQMNKLGSEGWEIVGIVHESNSENGFRWLSHYAILKREKLPW